MNFTRKDFRRIVNTYLKEHNIKVRTYLKGIHGRAYLRAREISIPRPVDTLTLYICLHEIGHIVALNEIPVSSCSWLHEYKATAFALKEAKRHGIVYPRDVKKAIIGYFKYRLKGSIRPNTIHNIHDEAFSLAGLDKKYWMRQIKAGKRFSVSVEVEEGHFLEWRSVSIDWSDKPKTLSRIKK